MADGFWLRADRQEGGRGRQGRAWQSPPGNLYASTIVRLRPDDPPIHTLAMVGAVALADAVQGLTRFGERLRIKWPNDLMLDGAKLAGILMERIEAVVVMGFGVNLAHAPDLKDRRTVALADAGSSVTPGELVTALADAVAVWLTRWRAEGVAAIRQAWLANSYHEGTPIRTHHPDGRWIEGRFGGITADGALIVECADGERAILHAADVFLA